jgi:ElaB/YqjD/DUF883 family membrane-anchored ribosome-binding protein
MSDPKIAQEKVATLGASVASSVDEALQQALPAMDRITHRFKDDLHDLGNSGKDLAMDVKHKLESEVQRHRLNAEQFIQRKPLNSVLIAAGTGALTALAVSWLLRSRKC